MIRQLLKLTLPGSRPRRTAWTSATSNASGRVIDLGGPISVVESKGVVIEIGQ
jgi:hypothetical protein